MDNSVIFWPVLLLLWSAVVLLLTPKDLVLAFRESSMRTEVSFLQGHYIISASKQSLMFGELCFFHPHGPDMQSSTDHGNGAANSTDTSVSIHCLTWCHSQKSWIFINTAVRSSNSAHSNISFIKLGQMLGRECLGGVLVYIPQIVHEAKVRW